MSKMDNLRAMREARYERAQSGGTTARRTLVAPASAAKSQPEPEASPAEALCGHRNMSGRTCTRESGHAAKSHRYS
jgi:hypothetical protein